MATNEIRVSSAKNRRSNQAIAGRLENQDRGSVDRDRSILPITDHARMRWAERASDAESDIETALVRSIPVDAPQRECDSARLYAPCDVVFRVQDGKITSVWPANYDTLATDDLGRCEKCENLERFTGVEQICRWCRSHAATIEMANGVTVRFNGEK